MSGLTFPGCGRAMHSLALSRAALAPLSIDACDDCQALWFDATESQQLTPGAVIELFRAIASSQPTRRDAYPPLLPCPRCTTPLTVTQDLQHTTRFTYYRCRYGHGRFTPYVQFLREKNFIRPLDPAELGRLRAIVATVRCVSCGGPVPLDRSPVCPYCGAPVMLLDPQSVTKALDRLQEAETKRTAAEPMSGDAPIAIANVERALAENRHQFEGESGIDLVMAGMHALRSLLGR
jgi:DNA-directed RNA polymerase subunit RPC12/RpoP